MFVPAVTGVQHGAVDLLCQQIDGPRLRVPHHQQVGVHRIQRQRRVDQGFALFDAGGLHRHVHHGGPKPLACQFETGLGPGRSLKEHVDLGQPRQHVARGFAPAVQVGISISGINQGGDIAGGQMFDAQEVRGAE